MIVPKSAESIGELAKRYYCDYRGYCYDSHSSWYNWGRWLLAGLLIFFGILFFALLSIFMRRRNRKAAMRRYGNQPTPAMANTPYQPGPPPPQQGGAFYSPPQGPPPPQAAPYGNGAYGESAGYYGQDAGVTQPQNAYVKA